MPAMTAARALLSLAALSSVLIASHACVTRGAALPPTLAQVVDSYHRGTAPYFPFTASERGARQYDRFLANDISEEYRRGLADVCGRHRGRLRRIDPSPLSDQERLTYEIFDYNLTTCLERLGFPWHLMPVNQLDSWPIRFPIVGAGKGTHPFRTVRNYDDFLGRIDGFVAWVDTAIANMRVGMARGITLPRAVMLRVVPQLETQIVDDPRASVYYEPVRNFPKGFGDDDRRQLEERYREAIAEKIVPAYRKLLAFVRDEYLPRCRTSYGLADLPGGADMYRSAARVSTTTTLTPDEIFELGRAEARRITIEIDAVRAEIAASPGEAPIEYGDLDALLTGYAELRGAVEAALPKLFGRVPRARFEIRPIEVFREASMPSSYQASSLDGSRPGVFYLNIAVVRRGGRARVSRNLFLHEAVPGHHLQIALQRENDALPDFRRFAWYTAFGEGWALYAEGLGTDLGVYRSPHDRLNRLYAERFRAARLVVDVGLHEKGWTRERAIEYIGGSRENAEREIDRYMAWPGQALGYKIGELRILAIRRKAEAALGAAFDLRAFHDELLADGAMPLNVLEAKMDRWITTRARSR